MNSKLCMEGAMQQRRYVIDKRDHEWIVSANGSDVLMCKQKRVAVQAAKEASYLLCCEDRLDEEEAELS